MGKHFYIGAVEYTRWADKSTLANATQEAAQGTVAQFSVGLQNYANMYMGVGGVLPVLPQGHVPIMYIDVPDEGSPAVYDILFSGILNRVDISDASVAGMTTVAVATPAKPLKRVLASVVFWNDAAHEMDDVSRVRRLGQVVGGQLPDWDFTTYVSTTPSITYPPAITGDWPIPYNSGDLWTDYQHRSIEDILNSIATDPGWFPDALYPAPARNWWVEGDFATPGDPTSGVIWYVHYLSVPDPMSVTVDLIDVPDPALDTADVYGSGASIIVSTEEVVRAITIAGPSVFPGSGNNTMTAMPASFGGGPRGEDGKRFWAQPRMDTIYKRYGVDGVWDTGAVDNVEFYDEDFEATCQILEVYLQHDTFQSDGDVGRLRARETNMGALWEDTGATNPMGIRNNLAVPTLPPAGTIGSAMATSVIDCLASTCNLRTHLARNRIGARLIFRHFDLYNQWYVAVKDSGHYAVYKMVGGTPIQMGADIASSMADMQEIKVSLRNSDAVNVVEVYIDDVIKYTVDDDFLWNMTRHGIGVDCDADASAFDAAFYDFQCTAIWGDRAFGMGDSTFTPPENTEGGPISWIYQSFCFIFNSDGTIDLGYNGDPLGTTAWEPTMYDDERSYTYFDRFKVLTAKYTDAGTTTVKRKVQWLKQKGGQGEWIMLAEALNVTVPLPTVTAPWHVQFSAKERGAAICNIMRGYSYSNLFVATDPGLTPLFGEPYSYPANGLLQADFLTSYVKRQQVADAIFRLLAEPRITATVETMTKIPRGEQRRLTSRRAGWVNDLILGDTRKVLICKSSVRVETGNLAVPKYRSVLSNSYGEVDDPGRTYLLQPGTDFHPPQNMPESAEFDGYALTWNEHVLSGPMFYGQKLRAMIIPYNEQSWENKSWPSMVYDGPVNSLVIPPEQLTPGKQYRVMWRTESIDGSIVSEWSKGLTIVGPPKPPDGQLSAIYMPFGNGVDPISSAPGANYYSECTIPAACRMSSWSASLDGADVVGDITFDVEYLSLADRRGDGAVAYRSMRGTGQAPAIRADMYNGSFAEGYDMVAWSPQSKDMRYGDYIRLKIISADTLATSGMFTLYLQAIGSAFTQVQGEPTSQPPVVDGPPGGSVALVDSDGQPLVGM